MSYCSCFKTLMHVFKSTLALLQASEQSRTMKHSQENCESNKKLIFAWRPSLLPFLKTGLLSFGVGCTAHFKIELLPKPDCPIPFQTCCPPTNSLLKSCPSYIFLNCCPPTNSLLKSCPPQSVAQFCSETCLQKEQPEAAAEKIDFLKSYFNWEKFYRWFWWNERSLRCFD